jgi:hypothetical protein
VNGEGQELLNKVIERPEWGGQREPSDWRQEGGSHAGRELRSKGQLLAKDESIDHVTPRVDYSDVFSHQVSRGRRCDDWNGRGMLDSSLQSCSSRPHAAGAQREVLLRVCTIALRF